MKVFIRIRNDGTTDFCYLVEIHAGSVYYGHSIPGRENKVATAVMTLDYFNRLIKAGMIIGLEEVAA